jgi:hypothetical protein
VIDRGPAVAPSSTSAKLSVELLEEAWGDLADRLVAEGRVQVELGIGLVALAGRLLDLVHPQPGLHRGSECSLGPRVSLLVDLGAEALQEAVGLGLVGGRLREPQLLAREWVSARVDEHLIGVAPPPHMSPGSPSS